MHRILGERSLYQKRRSREHRRPYLPPVGTRTGVAAEWRRIGGRGRAAQRGTCPPKRRRENGRSGPGSVSFSGLRGEADPSGVVLMLHIAYDHRGRRDAVRSPQDDSVAASYHSVTANKTRLKGLKDFIKNATGMAAPLARTEAPLTVG